MRGYCNKNTDQLDARCVVLLSCLNRKLDVDLCIKYRKNVVWDISVALTLVLLILHNQYLAPLILRNQYLAPLILSEPIPGTIDPPEPVPGTLKSPEPEPDTHASFTIGALIVKTTEVNFSFFEVSIRMGTLTHILFNK